jgi:hypothetical protein
MLFGEVLDASMKTMIMEENCFGGTLLSCLLLKVIA